MWQRIAEDIQICRKCYGCCNKPLLLGRLSSSGLGNTRARTHTHMHTHTHTHTRTHTLSYLDIPCINTSQSEQENRHSLPWKSRCLPPSVCCEALVCPQLSSSEGWAENAVGQVGHRWKLDVIFGWRVHGTVRPLRSY